VTLNIQRNDICLEKHTPKSCTLFLLASQKVVMCINTSMMHIFNKHESINFKVEENKQPLPPSNARCGSISPVCNQKKQEEVKEKSRNIRQCSSFCRSTTNGVINRFSYSMLPGVSWYTTAD
jgi:hypothetical protein